MAQAKITRGFNSWISNGEIIKFEDELKSKGFEIEAVNVIRIFGTRTIRWEVNFVDR